MAHKAILLIVDDDPTVLTMYQHILQNDGYKTLAANSGLQALELAHTHKPDLMLLDVNLADLSGIEVCKKIKADSDLQDILVVLFSGLFTESEEQAAGLESGADGYITLPVPNRELLARVQALLRMRQAEIKLRESQERYHTIADFNHDWEYWTDLDGAYQYVSPTCERISGYSADDFMQDKNLLLNIVHPDDREVAAHHKSKIESLPQESTIEFRIITRSGETRWISHICTPVTNTGGRWLGRRASNRDITAQKKSERVLQLRVELLEFSANHTQDELLVKALDEAEDLTGSSIGFLNFVAEDQNNLILQASSTRTAQEFCQIENKGLHFSIDQAGVWAECVHKKTAVIHNDYASLPNRKGLPEGHAPLQRQLLVPVLRNEKIIAILGLGNKMADYNAQDVELATHLVDICWEIAYKRNTEENLAKSQADIQALFQSMTEHVALHEIVYDDSGKAVDYRILDCNPAFTRITGISHTQAVGALASQLYGTGEAPYLEQYAAVAETGQSIQFETSFEPMRKHFSISAFSPEKGKFGIVSNDITEQKLAAMALQESETRYRLLAENISDVIWILDLETLRFRYISPSIERLRGYSAEEMMAQSLSDALTPESLHEFEQILPLRLARIQEGGNRAFVDEVGQPCKDGSTIWTEITTRFLVDPDSGKMEVYGVSRDITERKHAEKIIQAKDDLLRMTAQMANIGSWEFDVETLEVTMTDEVVRIHDLDPAQSASHELGMSFYLPQSRASVEKAIREAIELAKPYSLELEMVSAKGQHKWVHTVGQPVLEDGRVTKIRGVFQDISDRKRIELELKEWNSLLSATLENTHEPILALDRNFCYLGYNQAHAAFMKSRYNAEIQLGGNLAGYFSDQDDWLAIKTNLDRALQGETLTIAVHPWQSSQDVEQFIEFVYNPIRMETGEIFGVSVFAHDVTERKQAEQALQEYSTRLEAQVFERTRQLQEAHEKLIHQERLAVLGRLAGSVGQELRNPLGVISNALYYLRLLMPEAEDRVIEYLGIIENQVKISDKTIRDLLNYSRIDTARRQAMILEGLVRQAINRLPPPPEIAASLEFPPDLPAIFVDPRHLDMILDNLIRNAYQAMPEGGNLVIRAAPAGDQASVLLHITDTGVGIPEENKEKIFEPLFTTKPRGVGLGLVICQKLAEANKANIELVSELGKGSTFTLYLPVQEDNP
jgi:PAS domain S-box-containing protein